MALKIGVILLVVLLAVLLAIVLNWWAFKNKKRKLEERIPIWWRVTYQAGYDDYKAGKPKEDLDDAISMIRNQSQRNILNALKPVYQEGYQDAMDNLPSQTEQFRELEKKQLRILERIQKRLAELA